MSDALTKARIIAEVELQGQSRDAVLAVLARLDAAERVCVEARKYTNQGNAMREAVRAWEALAK